MFGMGWWELSIVGLITIIILGPKELPFAMKSLAKVMRKARRLASEFQGHVDDIVKEAEIGDIQKTVRSLQQKDIGGVIENTISPIKDVKSEIEDSISDVKSSIDEIESNNTKVASSEETLKNSPADLKSNNEDSSDLIKVKS